MKSAILIEARGLTRLNAARNTVLLAPTDFRLEAGRRVALMGPSGAGKSVFMRALARLDPLDGGELFWRGAPVTHPMTPDYRRHVAYVRQRPAMVDGTVEDLLRFPYGLGVYRGAQFDRARVEALAQAAGRAPDFLDKRVRELSGGEAQIAALLRVLQLEPEVLLLDEPTAALDPAAVRSVEALVAAWFDAAPEQRAYLWISHDLGQAERTCTQRLIMQAGQLQSSEARA